MARIKHGFLGAFHGKLGTGVGYILNGEAIVRAVPRRNENREFTVKELGNQQVFTILQYWLQPVTLFLRVGFKNYSPKSQGFTAAKSYNSSRAIAGEYPNYFVDPAKAFVSFGHLNPAEEATATATEPGKILLTWRAGEFVNGEKAMYVLYDVENREVVSDTSAVFRAREKYEIELEEQHIGRKFHVYLAFVTSDQSNQSTSQYLGEVTVL